MNSAAGWTRCVPILTLFLSSCATAPSEPPPVRLVVACPRVEPLPEAFRAELVALLAALEPPHLQTARRALAEWGALREQARACNEFSSTPERE